MLAIEVSPHFDEMIAPSFFTRAPLSNEKILDTNMTVAKIPNGWVCSERVTSPWRK
jgi:hypothetical protein